MYGVGSEGFTANDCQICGEHFDCIQQHLCSEPHRVHAGLHLSYPSLNLTQRWVLVENKVTVKNGWLFCTLCNSKSFSFDNMMPHIQSVRHMRKLSWTAAESVSVRATFNAEQTVESPVSGSDSNKLERITYACKELKKVYYSIQNGHVASLSTFEIEEIVERCDTISRHVREIKNRCKTLIKDRPKEKDQRNCVVCLDRERSRVLLPCRHYALCETCWSSLPKRDCPVCRSPVNDVVEPLNC